MIMANYDNQLERFTSEITAVSDGTRTKMVMGLRALADAMEGGAKWRSGGLVLDVDHVRGEWTLNSNLVVFDPRTKL
jgi:hypothetical protein